MEIRIYYESLEQAKHFLQPIIDNYKSEKDETFEVKLVQMISNYEYYGGKVANIIFWKNPDILLSLVRDNEEYPLLLIEFSTAVFTEDHEIQRFDGIVAAAENNCIYTKISPLKESTFSHGGNIDFDHLKPYSQIYTRFGLYPFFFEWPTNENNKIMKTHENYLACPPFIEEFKLLIENLLNTVINNKIEDDWTEELFDKLENKNFFNEWFKKLEGCNVPCKEEYKKNSSRIYWITRENSNNNLELKFNRFGHAMDPERGLLPYNSFIDKNIGSKMIFDENNNSWYNDTPKEDAIRKYLREVGINSKTDLLKLFMMGSGLYKFDAFKEIVKNYKGDDIIDISNFINHNYFDLNKPLRVIFKFSNYFKIEHPGEVGNLILKWDDFKENGEKELFSKFKDITEIKERKTISEDEVTYITAYSVLKENGFNLVAISYPGAQGDKAILVEPDKGRKQKRKYVDIISYIDKIINLQENKGKFSPKKIQGDISEVTTYKNKEEYRKALDVFKKKYDLPHKIDNITVGVGFWANKRFKVKNVLNLDLDNLDYFVYINHNLTEWQIWSNTCNDLFEKKTGKIDLSKMYSVKKISNKKLINLDEFN